MIDEIHKIKGAGIAGLTYGIDLLKTGKTVQVFDFNEYKDKLCGGILTDKAYNLLSTYIDVPVSQNIEVVKVYDKTKLITTLDFKDKPIKIINRSQVDKALMDKFKELGGIFRIADNKIEYDIDASGCTDKVSGFCLSKRIPQTTNEISIVFGYVKNGYCWIIPNEGYSNVGIGISQDYRKDVDIQKAFEKFNSDFKIIWYNKCRGHKIPCRVSKKDKTIGDAFGAIDYLTGEGIYSALCRDKKKLIRKARISKIIHNIFYLFKPICLLFAKNKAIQDLVMKYIQGVQKFSFSG